MDNKEIAEAIESMSTLKVTGAKPGVMTGICYDSRQAKPGSVFVAIPGEQVDGHDFIGQAIANGATTIVAQREPETPLPNAVTLIVVPDARAALSQMAAYYYDHPAGQLSVVGITGTNGKTTVSYLIQALLAAGGKKCARIGTTGYEIMGRHYPALTTTPESSDLQKMLSEAVDRKATHVTLEVSSHALSQSRADNVAYRAAVYTNLSRDHLDYHTDMESYFAAKARLFTTLAPALSVINIDDPFASRLLGLAEGDLVTYGLEGFSDVTAKRVALDANGTSFVLATPQGERAIRSPLIGWHNIYNMLAAAAVALAEEIPLDVIAQALHHFQAAPGRFEKIDTGHGYQVVVDYAHTDDALSAVLKTARELCRGKVITLFGCGGDRDRSKRPLMGEAAWSLSDKVVVTSDNPRTEDPQKIIDDILTGIDTGQKPSGALTVIPDRRQAIGAAISMAEEGDMIIIAGKGHEDYQIVGTTKTHFDDREEARAAIKERHGKK